jgi:16S rRNA (cytosine1402-N4)-methyltransferase
VTKQYSHRPVLLDEVLAGLSIKADGIYVDGTFGRGGHAGAILAMLGPEGRLLAMDKDPEAVQSAETQFGGDRRFAIEQGSFTMLGSMVARQDLQGKVNGLLLDLGVSSPQLDDASRGFSFSEEGPLDMRMDPTQGISAAQWLNEADEKEISRVLKTLGEERFSRRIARAIVAQRATQPLQTTRELAELIAAAVPMREKHKHPATRSFQAIRIFINSELDDVRSVLEQVPDMLATHGRMAVISFHSLEDRIVKRFIRDEYRGEQPPQAFPLAGMDYQPRLKPVGKAIRASEKEISENPRARSAVLRIAERLQ